MSKPSSYDNTDGFFHFPDEYEMAKSCPLIEFFAGTVNKNIRIENIFRRETRNEVNAPLICIRKGAVIENLSLGMLSQSFPDRRNVPMVVDQNEIDSEKA